MLKYARGEDWAKGAGVAAAGPAAMIWMEAVSPSYAGRGGFRSILRLSAMGGLMAGFFFVYNRTCSKLDLATIMIEW